MRSITKQAYWVYETSDGEKIRSREFLNPPGSEYVRMSCIAVSKIRANQVRKPIVFRCTTSYYSAYELIFSIADILNIDASLIDFYIYGDRGRISNYYIVVDEYELAYSLNINISILHNSYLELIFYIKDMLGNHYGFNGYNRWYEIVSKIEFDLSNDIEEIDKTKLKTIYKQYKKENTEIKFYQTIDFWKQKFMKRAKNIYNQNHMKICDKISSLISNENEQIDYNTIYSLVQKNKFDVPLAIIASKFMKERLINWSCGPCCDMFCGIKNIKDIFKYRYHSIFTGNNNMPIDNISFQKNMQCIFLFSIASLLLKDKYFKIDNNLFVHMNLFVISIIDSKYETVTMNLQRLLERIDNNTNILSYVSRKNILQLYNKGLNVNLYNSDYNDSFFRLLYNRSPNSISTFKILIKMTSNFYNSYKKSTLNIISYFDRDQLEKMLKSTKIRKYGILSRAIFIDNLSNLDINFSNLEANINKIIEFKNMTSDVISVSLQDASHFIELEIKKIERESLLIGTRLFNLELLKSLIFKFAILLAILNQKNLNNHKEIIISENFLIQSVSIVRFIAENNSYVNSEFGISNQIKKRILYYLYMSKQKFFYRSFLKKNFAQTETTKKYIKSALDSLINEGYLHQGKAISNIDNTDISDIYEE